MPDSISAAELDTIVKEEYASNPGANHRRYDRVDYTGAIVLTRFSADTGRPTGDSIVAEGRDISVGGLRFVHQHELPGEVLAAALRDFDGEIRKVLVRPLRTTPTDDGRLESACRFIQPQPNLIPQNSRALSETGATSSSG